VKHHGIPESSDTALVFKSELPSVYDH
jgi:hypothetical protein